MSLCQKVKVVWKGYFLCLFPNQNVCLFVCSFILHGPSWTAQRTSIIVVRAGTAHAPSGQLEAGHITHGPLGQCSRDVSRKRFWILPRLSFSLYHLALCSSLQSLWEEVAPGVQPTMLHNYIKGVRRGSRDSGRLWGHRKPVRRIHFFLVSHRIL